MNEKTGAKILSENLTLFQIEGFLTFPFNNPKNEYLSSEKKNSSKRVSGMTEIFNHPY